MFKKVKTAICSARAAAYIETRKVSGFGNKIIKGVLMAYTTITLAAMMTPMASAADIWTKAADVMKNVYGKILMIDTGIAALMLVICFLTFQFCKDERKQTAAKSWAIKIALAWVGINVIGLIISYAQTTIGDDGHNIDWINNK